ncbi:MAG: OmpH family outer membrane protein [Geminicoccaceae bacterium]
MASRLSGRLGLLLALMLGLAAAVPAVPALAQQAVPAAVVVIVDYARILRDAKAAQAIRDQIDARRKVYQDQIAKEEKRLYDADKELAKQRSVMAADKFAEKRKAFEQDVVGVQRIAQQRRRELDQVATAALGEVRNALVELVGTLADERGFNIVLPSSAVLLFSPEIDMTDEVLKRLDEKLPTVKVPAKAPEPAAAPKKK